MRKLIFPRQFSTLSQNRLVSSCCETGLAALGWTHQGCCAIGTVVSHLLHITVHWRISYNWAPNSVWTMNLAIIEANVINTPCVIFFILTALLLIRYGLMNSPIYWRLSKIFSSDGYKNKLCLNTFNQDFRECHCRKA